MKSFMADAKPETLRWSYILDVMETQFNIHEFFWSDLLNEVLPASIMIVSDKFSAIDYFIESSIMVINSVWQIILSSPVDTQYVTMVNLPMQSNCYNGKSKSFILWVQIWSIFYS